MNLKLEQLSSSFSKNLKTPTLTYIPNINSLLIYGHQPPIQQSNPKPAKKSFTFKVEKAQAPTSQKINIYNLQKKEWSYVQATGKIPPNRMCHKVIYMEQHIFLYGGCSQSTPVKTFNEVYVLNPVNWVWKKLIILDNPPHSLDYSIAKLTEHKIIIVDKQVWILNLKDAKWQVAGNDIPGAVWNKIQIVEQIPKSIAVGVLSPTQVYLFSEKAKISLINLQSKNICDLQSVAVIKDTSKANIIVRQANELIVLTDNAISTFILQDNKIPEADFQEIDIKWTTSERTQEGFYILNENNQIYLADLSVVKTTRQMYSSPTPNYQPNDSCIIQESHQSSAIYSRENFPQDNPTTIPNKQTFFGQQSQQHIQQRSHNEIRMSSQLKTIFAQQHFKRKLLEAKGQLLQQGIKKCQKVVLALCKYGGQRQKRQHIEDVKQLRQDLQTIWSKQLYYRKQIESRVSKLPMRQILLENLKQDYVDYFVE